MPTFEELLQPVTPGGPTGFDISMGQAMNNVAGMALGQAPRQSPMQAYQDSVMRNSAINMRRKSDEAIERYRESTLKNQRKRLAADEAYRGRTGDLAEDQFDLNKLKYENQLAIDERDRAMNVLKWYTEGETVNELGQRYNPRERLMPMLMSAYGMGVGGQQQAPGPSDVTPAPGGPAGQPPGAAMPAPPPAAMPTGPTDQMGRPILTGREAAMEKKLQDALTEDVVAMRGGQDQAQAAEIADLRTMVASDQGDLDVNVGMLEGTIQDFFGALFDTPSYRRTQQLRQFVTGDVAKSAKQLGVNPTDFDVKYLEKGRPKMTSSEPVWDNYFARWQKWYQIKQMMTAEKEQILRSGGFLKDYDELSRFKQLEQQIDAAADEQTQGIRAAATLGLPEEWVGEYERIRATRPEGL